MFLLNLKINMEEAFEDQIEIMDAIDSQVAVGISIRYIQTIYSSTRDVQKLFYNHDIAHF